MFLLLFHCERGTYLQHIFFISNFSCNIVHALTVYIHIYHLSNFTRSHIPVIHQHFQNFFHIVRSVCFILPIRAFYLSMRLRLKSAYHWQIVVFDEAKSVTVYDPNDVKIAKRKVIFILKNWINMPNTQ